MNNYFRWRSGYNAGGGPSYIGNIIYLLYYCLTIVIMVIFFGIFIILVSSIGVIKGIIVEHRNSE